MTTNINNFMRSLATATFMCFAAVLSFTAPASAVIVDFTAADWLGSNTVNKVIGGHSVTVTAITGGILNADGINGSVAPCVAFLSCQHDGIGISVNNDGDDEVGGIGGFEILRVSFLTAVDIGEIGFLDLFTLANEQTETASWSTDGSTNAIGSVSGTGANTNGFESITSNLGLTGISFIDFFIAGDSNDNSDFALAYLTIEESTSINEVPLPASAYLFGTALLAMGALGRRRRKKQAAI